MNSRKVKLIGALASAPLILPIGSFAEEGVRATLGVSSRLESVSESGFNDPQREGERLVTGLSFGLTSENNSQTLGFFADTDLAFNSNSDVDDEFDVEDPSARFVYNLESRQSTLDIVARYRRTDVDNANFFDEFDTSDVETGEGDRTNVSVRTGLVLGREAPITFDFSHLYARNTFSGGTDDNTSDSTTNRVDATLSFQVSQVASVRLIGNWREVDRDDAGASDQTNQSFGVGTTYELSKVLTLNGQVTYDEADTTNTTREDASGLGFVLGLDRAMTNGTLGFDISSEETVNGARQQAQISRTMLIPRGTLSYAIGATKTGGSSIDPLVNLGLSYDTSPTSRVNVNLSQSSSINDDDDETIRTRLNVGYTHSIDEISSISATADFASQDAVEDGGIDRTTITASLTYRRAVGGDWDMVTGYEYRSSRRDNQENRNRSTLFVGLEKNFDWRP